MAKNKKIIGIFILFIALSLGSGVLMFKYLSPKRTTVFVFNDNYAAGTQVTQEMLTPMQVDSSIIVNGIKGNSGQQFVTINEYASVIQAGNSLRMDVWENSPLMLSMLSVENGSAIEKKMKTTAIGVTIGVNDVTGITNDLKYGSRVNVYMSIEGTTTLILENMRVLEVSYSNGIISSVTLECDINQSLLLINANSYGAIHLGLVNSNGYQHSEIEMPTFSLYGQ